MIVRVLALVAMVLAAAVYTAPASRAEAPVDRVPLSELPHEIAGWMGESASPLADDVVAQLGVDDYVHRRYVRGTSRPSEAVSRTGLASGAAASIPIGLYAGFYQSQRQGDTIHSPQNCLPGAGWRPVNSGTVDLAVGDRRVTVNRYIIQKGLDRQVVLYWYQGRGRVVANEYMNKALLMVDAARLHRTSGGLVRLIAPVVTTAEAATDELTAFAATLFPQLERHLP